MKSVDDNLFLKKEIGINLALHMDTKQTNCLWWSTFIIWRFKIKQELKCKKNLIAGVLFMWLNSIRTWTILTCVFVRFNPRQIFEQMSSNRLVGNKFVVVESIGRPVHDSYKRNRILSGFKNTGLVWDRPIRPKMDDQTNKNQMKNFSYYTTK